MARYSDYISNEEYDEALRRYHNGFDNFTDHIQYKKSVAQVIINTDTIEDYLEEGEEYTILDTGYVITSYGRVFNLRFRRFLKPSSTTVMCICTAVVVIIEWNLHLKKWVGSSTNVLYSKGI